MKKTTGLVIWKFMPLHKGHESLLKFADNFVDQLFVVVDNVNPELFPEWYISGEKRVAWIQELLPSAKVFYIGENTPQQPDEHPDFWNYWKNILLNITKIVPDFLIASEEYGFKLWEVLDCEYIPFDIGRNMISTCATDIRFDLSNNFDYLSDIAKKDFTAKICITGPESTGKSTLAGQLAESFDTISIPEYARDFTELKIEKDSNFEFSLSDMYHIWKGQISLEDSMMSQANKVLFSDTDALVTTVRSRWLCDGKIDNRLEKLAQEKRYDLYLLTYPDIEWEKDNIRYFPEEDERIRFFEDCKAGLEKIWANYIVVKGQGKERFEMAREIVEKFMKEKYKYNYFIKGR